MEHSKPEEPRQNGDTSPEDQPSPLQEELQEIQERLDAHEVYHVAQEHRLFAVVKNLLQFVFKRKPEGDEALNEKKRWPAVRAAIPWFLGGTGGGGGLAFFTLLLSAAAIYLQLRANQIGKSDLEISKDGNYLTFLETQQEWMADASNICKDLEQDCNSPTENCLPTLRRLERLTNSCASFAENSPVYQASRSKISRLNQAKYETIPPRGRIFKCLIEMETWDPTYEDALMDIQLDRMWLEHARRMNGRDKKIQDLDVNGSYFKDVIITGTKLPFLDAQNCIFHDVKFVGCDLTSADFSGSIFHKVDFTATTLHSAIFDGAEFYGNIILGDSSDFKGALTSQIQYFPGEEFEQRMQ